jgi:hypothetical protein
MASVGPTVGRADGIAVGKSDGDEMTIVGTADDGRAVDGLRDVFGGDVGRREAVGSAGSDVGIAYGTAVGKAYGTAVGRGGGGRLASVGPCVRGTYGALVGYAYGTGLGRRGAMDGYKITGEGGTYGERLASAGAVYTGAVYGGYVYTGAVYGGYVYTGAVYGGDGAGGDVYTGVPSVWAAGGASVGGTVSG